MTQTSPSHRRSPSTPYSKSKTSRPVLHRRGTSGATVTISKLGSGKDRGVKPSQDDFDMASFLNFCAMCENQITTPNNSLLYCSESCRRKDSCKPLSASLPSMSTMSTTPPASPPLSPRTIVAPMTPTGAPFHGNTSHTHDAKSDLDPTEWKPVLLRSSSSLASSDAWNYLSQFHGEPMRPTVHRSSSSLPALAGGNASSHSRVPSLTNTPSVASSFSSTASDYLGSLHESRPLPPRHNPYFSGTSVSKGMELVVPHIAVNDDLDPVGFSDSGSIFPASSAVWEDSCDKRSKPITMARGVGGRPAGAFVKN
ncbi:hypothetical protein MYU51_002943 [Penicillium brevicompactum]|uniref:uncharacterized protein n=1 Tax=Penicillium brevicompactum TaxID=5074 RepID=UPI00254108D3|nr:uncharacterized protein N7506_011255 [Penicillium brevicompactum]KAJ5322125.1 hypothetical protein N7506_011255 [Penicillium brevicompactum]